MGRRGSLSTCPGVLPLLLNHALGRNRAVENQADRGREGGASPPSEPYGRHLRAAIISPVLTRPTRARNDLNRPQIGASNNVSKLVAVNKRPSHSSIVPASAVTTRARSAAGSGPNRCSARRRSALASPSASQS